MRSESLVTADPPCVQHMWLDPPQGITQTSKAFPDIKGAIDRRSPAELQDLEKQKIKDEPRSDRKSGTQLMVVSPHPDDAEYAVGGILAKGHENGLSTKITCMKILADDLKSVIKEHPRETEAESAASRLGCEIEFLECMPYSNRAESVLNVVKAVRQDRPEIIFVNHQRDSHPFHRFASKLVSDAIFFAGTPSVIVRGTKPWQVRQLFFYEAYSGKMPQPDFYVDVSKFFRKAKDALLEHKLGLALTPGLDYKMTVAHLQYGSAAGVQYAEALKIAHLGWFDSIAFRTFGLEFIGKVNSMRG